MGLRRGFIEAGTQNLLMTLWPISDEATVQIMSDFYEAADAIGNAPQALAKVQRDWLLKPSRKRGPSQSCTVGRSVYHELPRKALIHRALTECHSILPRITKGGERSSLRLRFNGW
jgi:hypothetical protein